MTLFDDNSRSFSALKSGRCKWCGSPFHTVYCSGLCSHCYSIKRDKQQLVEVVHREMVGGIAWKALDLRLRVNCVVAGKTEEHAKSEGEGIIHERQPQHSAMAIEELLVYISKELLPRRDPLRDCYRNYAGIISDLFSPAQREALIHLLSQVVSQHEKHRRKKRLSRPGYELVAESKDMPAWLKHELEG